jgi:plastocyanin
MRSWCAQTALLLLTVAGCGTSPGGGLPPPTAPAPSDTAQIVIDNFAFSPHELTIPAGTRVVWTNRDDVPHTATSTVKPRTFDSGALDTDDSYSFVFNAPGTYEYFCAVHPHMTGKVIVK